MNGCSEWAVNQQRDSLASFVGHPHMLTYFAVAQNESVGRTRYELLEVRDRYQSINAWDIMLLTSLCICLSRKWSYLVALDLRLLMKKTKIELLASSRCTYLAHSLTRSFEYSHRSKKSRYCIQYTEILLRRVNSQTRRGAINLFLSLALT